MRAVGLQCVFDEPLGDESIDRVADLFVDPRWPWVPDQLRIGRVPGTRSERPTKQRGGRANVREALAAADVAEVGAICHQRERENHAWLYVHTGRHRVPGAAYPFEVRAFCRAEWMPEGTTIEPWLSVLHELVAAVGAAHGVIVVDDEAIVHDEVALVVTTANGARVNPRWAEVDRISGPGAARHGLGERFVRHPRWGTYLKPAHVSTLGGRERIEAVVQPAEIRDIGGLLYVQVTASTASADSPESIAKQRAFADLASSILVPARPA
jgi:hypothetical protein